MLNLKVCIITIMTLLSLCSLILPIVDIITEKTLLIEDYISLEIGFVILIMIFAVNRFI